MNGQEASGITKSDFTSKVKLIVLTASVLESERATILKMGCDDFRHQPFKTDELLMMTKHLGVCYTCAEENPAHKPNLSLLTLNDAFAAISDELQQELQQSIMEIDLDKIEQIIQQIGRENKLLVQAIEQHISNFEDEHILNLLQ